MKFKPFEKNISVRITGEPLTIRGFEYGKGEPSIYIQGGIHGGEITYWLFHKIMNYVEHTSFKGKITLVPIANPTAWQQRSYFYTVGKFNMYNGKDWNRSYPGNKSGRLEEVVAYHLFDIAKQHDLTLDLHTADKSVPYLIITDKPEYKKIAKAMGLKFNSVYTPKIKNKTGALTVGPLDEIGKLGITLECGTHDMFDPNAINTAFDAIKNLLTHLGHVKNAAPKTKTFISSKRTVITTDYSGFIDFRVQPGTNFKKGTLLYALYPSNELGKEIKYVATEDGYMVIVNPAHTVWVGDRTIEYVPTKDLEELK